MQHNDSLLTKQSKSLNKNFFKLALIVFCAGFFVFNSGLPAQASSASDYWKTYFSTEELKAVQKNAEKYTLVQIKNKSEQWHNILTGFNIKNGSITDDNIKKNEIATNKIKGLGDFIDEKISGSSTPQDFSANNLTGTYAALDGSHITNLTASQVGAVPYTGATSNLDLGSRTLITTSTGTFGNIKTPIISPATDSTSAFQINKADGSTNVLNVDTTNGRVGIGTVSPLNKLDVVGDASFSGLINGATISIYSIDQINSPNLFIGVGAGNNTMLSGSAYNTGIGYWSMSAVTAGNHNVGVGANALKIDTTGSENTAVGVNGLRDNTTGSLNTMIGTHALRHNITADANTAVGNSALLTNTAGYSNTAVGVNSLQALTTGFYNTAVGGASLYALTTGYKNTAIGYNAGQTSTGTYNTFIGNESGTTVAYTDKSMALGYNAKVSKDNQVVLGGSGVTETLLNGNVGIGTTTPAAALDINGQVKIQKSSSQPFACDATHDGTIALTSGYRTCVCKGGTTTWVFTTDGTTTCTW